MEQPLRDKLVAAAGAGLVVALLGLSLLLGLEVSSAALRDNIVVLLDVAPPPPPPPPTVREQLRLARPARKPPSPPNLRSEPTDVVVPPPLVIPPPRPQPIVAAPIAGTGTAPTAGAADRAGPGFGAGGEGNGRGGGGDGEGGDVPPIQIAGRLKFSDMPPALRVMGVARLVSVRYRVNIDGRASDCMITRSSGSAELDAVTCRKIEERFRFRPSRDADGNKVRSIVVETHEWSVHDPDAPPQL